MHLLNNLDVELILYDLSGQSTLFWLRSCFVRHDDDEITTI